MRSEIIISACVMQAVCSGAASGQDRPPSDASRPADPSQDGAAASSTGIGDIVVTARKRSESAQTVPISITALGDEKIRDYTIRSIAEVGQQAPGLYIAPSPASASGVLLAIRGQSQGDVLLTLDSSVGVYIDGVYYPRQLGINSAFTDFERIEVLKGPQGTLFGRNTTGGAISITTRQPDLDRADGFASATLGNYGRLDVSAALNLPIVDDVAALRVSGKRSTRNGFGRDFLGQDLSDENSTSLRANLLIHPGSGTRITLSGDYVKLDEGGQITRLASVNPNPATAPQATPTGLLTATAIQAGFPVTPDGLAAARNLLLTFVGGDPYRSFASTPQFSHFKRWGTSADLRQDITPTISLRSITAYSETDRSSAADIDGTPFRLFEPTFDTQSQVFSQELQLAQDSRSAFDWIIGGYYSVETGHELVASTSLVSINATNPGINEGNVRNTSIAAFGQAYYSLSDTLRLTGGLRYTSETKSLVSFNRTALGCNIPTSLRDGTGCRAFFKNTWGNVSYLASLDWRVRPDILVYVKHSRGFKGGGQNIRGSAASPISFSPFSPETVFDYEAGLKADLLDRRLRVNVAAFYSDYRNIQRSTAVALGGVVSTLITNATSGKIKGGELEITAAPTSRLTFNTSISYIHARYGAFLDAQIGDRSDEPFPIPKWTVATNATYAVPFGGGSLRLTASYIWQDDVNYRGSAVLDSAVTQPAFGLVNGRAALMLDRSKIEIAVFVKNMLDKRYIVGGIDLDRTLGFNMNVPGAPRTFGVDLTKRF